MEQILGEGKWARLVSRDGWEFVRRRRSTGIVVIIAVTEDEKLLLIEQNRVPVGGRVIELPAGLAGDVAGHEDEALTVAAARELEEETGFAGDHFEFLLRGPVSAGITDEIIHLYRARGVRRVGPGGGDASEDIQVHEVPLGEALPWLLERARTGALVDAKVFAALALA